MPLELGSSGERIQFRTTREIKELAESLAAQSDRTLDNFIEYLILKENSNPTDIVIVPESPSQ